MHRTSSVNRVQRTFLIYITKDRSSVNVKRLIKVDITITLVTNCDAPLYLTVKIIATTAVGMHACTRTTFLANPPNPIICESNKTGMIGRNNLMSELRIASLQ